MWDKRAQLVRVKDGDTIVAVLDQGFGDTKEIDVRLFGVWAPELDEPGGPEVKEFVQSWFLQQPLLKWPFVLTTVRMKVSDKEQVTLGRYVALVQSADGLRNLNVEIMLFVARQGYGGGTGAKDAGQGINP